MIINENRLDLLKVNLKVGGQSVSYISPLIIIAWYHRFRVNEMTGDPNALVLYSTLPETWRSITRDFGWIVNDVETYEAV